MGTNHSHHDQRWHRSLLGQFKCSEPWRETATHTTSHKNDKHHFAFRHQLDCRLEPKNHRDCPVVGRAPILESVETDENSKTGPRRNQHWNVKHEKLRTWRKSKTPKPGCGITLPRRCPGTERSPNASTKFTTTYKDASRVCVSVDCGPQPKNQESTVAKAGTTSLTRNCVQRPKTV